MNINNINRMGAANPYQKAQEQKGQAKQGAASSRKDEVSISAQAKQLAATEGGARAEKVEQLKTAVQQGTYHVETKALAEKILKYMQAGDFHDR